MSFDATILVVGSDSQTRERVSEAVDGEYHLVVAATSDEALSHIDDGVDLVICDGSTTSVDCLSFLRDWKSRQSAAPILVLVSADDVRLAVDAMKTGAADCMTKPIDVDDLRAMAMSLLNAPAAAEAERGGPGDASDRRDEIDIPPGTSLEDLERAAVQQALVQHHGNRTHAARMLGISVRTLQRKLKAWGLPVVALPTAATNTNFTLPGSPNSHHSYNVHAH